MAWLTGWTYRKSITLSRPSGVVSNYQMKLLLGESSGATAPDVDCDGKCLASFNDIRFTTSDGSTLLDYWIESITGATPNQLATIWIKFDLIDIEATTFYMYYGNSEAASVSDGTIFIINDNFERGVNGDPVGGGWSSPTGISEISTAHASEGTRSVHLVGKDIVGQRTLISKTIGVLNSSKFSFKMFINENIAYSIFYGGGGKCIYLYYNWVHFGYYYGNSVSPSHTQLVAGSAIRNAFHKIGVENIDFLAGTYDFYFDDNLVAASLPMYEESYYQGIFTIAGPSANGDDLWIDEIRFDNWLAVEPAWGSWGDEERVPVTRYWVGNAGNWNDTDHWAYTSGGVGGASVPTVDDNVIIDENSFTETGQVVIVDS